VYVRLSVQYSGEKAKFRNRGGRSSWEKRGRKTGPQPELILEEKGEGIIRKVGD